MPDEKSSALRSALAKYFEGRIDLLGDGADLVDGLLAIVDEHRCPSEPAHQTKTNEAIERLRKELAEAREERDRLFREKAPLTVIEPTDDLARVKRERNAALGTVANLEKAIALYETERLGLREHSVLEVDKARTETQRHKIKYEAERAAHERTRASLRKAETTARSRDSSGSTNPGFFMVWKQGSGATTPTYLHATKSAAEVQAERLSNLNPGVAFVVFSALVVVRSTLRARWTPLADCSVAELSNIPACNEHDGDDIPW